MIEQSTLLAVIDHNAETKPKPHHMNKDLMTALLQFERKENETRSK